MRCRIECWLRILLIISQYIRLQAVWDFHNASTGARTRSFPLAAPGSWILPWKLSNDTPPTRGVADATLLWHHSQHRRAANCSETAYGSVTNAFCLVATHSAPCVAASKAQHHLLAICNSNLAPPPLDLVGTEINKDKTFFFYLECVGKYRANTQPEIPRVSHAERVQSPGEETVSMIQMRACDNIYWLIFQWGQLSGRLFSRLLSNKGPAVREVYLTINFIPTVLIYTVVSNLDLVWQIYYTQYFLVSGLQVFGFTVCVSGSYAYLWYFYRKGAVPVSS